MIDIIIHQIILPLLSLYAAFGFICSLFWFCSNPDMATSTIIRLRQALLVFFTWPAVVKAFAQWRHP